MIARILQGIGGAMMTPVGRLVLLRSIDKSALVNAMAWVTVPALVGPVIGPPLGGFITTYFSWHWIFLINIPIGLLGIVHGAALHRPDHERRPRALRSLRAGAGRDRARRHRLRPFGRRASISCRGRVVVALVGIGSDFDDALCAPRAAHRSPVLDLTLLRLPTLRASIIGGFLFRLGIGALPFLLPLLLQVGFGLTPFHSGLVTLRLRGRRHGHEDAGRAHHPNLRLPQHHDRSMRW